MATTPVTSVGSPDFLPSSDGASPRSKVGEAFSRIIDNLLGNAGVQQGQADQAILDLATGNGDNYHRVLLNAAQADLTFRLILEVRNRLTDAFQEVMRMQV